MYKLKISWFTLTLLGALILSAGSLQAQALKKTDAQDSKEPLESVLSAYVVLKDAKGEESFQKAQSVQPGDVLEYRVVYRNISDKELLRLSLDLPIPEGTVWLEGVATPPKPLATSILGGSFETLPLKRKIKDKSGKETLVMVPIEQYKALRWEVAKLPPTKSFEAKMRVKVSDGIVLETVKP